jgi:hypothetical protein
LFSYVFVNINFLNLFLFSNEKEKINFNVVFVIKRIIIEKRGNLKKYYEFFVKYFGNL